jgi:glycopeptide antibiotics resistance protein
MTTIMFILYNVICYSIILFMLIWVLPKVIRDFKRVRNEYGEQSNER